MRSDITFHSAAVAWYMQNLPRKAASPRRTPWLFIALLWTTVWLAYQGRLLYQDVLSPISSVLGRQDWWRQGGSLDLIVGPALAFLLPALGLYVAFAWANVSAFHSLLLPRLHRSRDRYWA
jgi:hypothetical protein